MKNTALLLGFGITGTAKSGFRITASRDEGMISDGMFSSYTHDRKFDTLDEAKKLLARIEKAAHYCARYNALGYVCDLQHWVCTNGVFA